jgi:UDPglucose 6-dehydrogenase
VAKGMGMDKRIGSKFLHPGPGYGGSCFPKDTTALIRIAQEHGASCRIVEAAVEVNAAQKARMVKKIREALGGSEAGKTIAVLGLTFKPETDDMRDSPALAIIPNLVDKGANVQAHDPQGMDEAKLLLPGQVSYFNDVYEAAAQADVIVLLTEWNEYRGLNFERLRELMQGNAFVDLRNVYERQHVSGNGFDYYCIGR